MSTLSKAAIFAAQDIKRETLPVPEWGGDIELIQLSGTARAEIMGIYQEFSGQGSLKQTHALQDAMLVACIADENGVPLFNKDDVPGLRAKNGVVLERIVKAALALNGMNAAAEEAEKKDSGETPNAPSPSVSAAS